MTFATCEPVEPVEPGNGLNGPTGTRAHGHTGKPDNVHFGISDYDKSSYY